MPTPLSGPGIGLPLPQNLYPSELQNAPIDQSSNRQALAPGETLPLPAGTWYISLGQYLVLQYLDPVTNVWVMGSTAAWIGGIQYVKSDGFNCRIANLLGCPVSATITSYGSAYVQASTTVTAVGSTSTWVPIVGGQLTTTAATIVSGTGGAGYGVAPLVMIPPPPPASTNPNGVGGVQASAYAVISSGTVSGITFTNPGAGYPSAPAVVIQPSPTDPNLATGITQASVSFSLTGSGKIAAVLCTNNGAPITPTAITLTPAGAGVTATLTANVLQTITAASVSGAGTGFGTLAVGMTTVGGAPAQGTVTNGPDFLYLAFRPRQAQIALTVTGGGGTVAAQLGAIYDGGMFQSAPNFVLQTQPLTASTLAYVAPTVALTMGSVPDIAVVQPAP